MIIMIKDPTKRLITNPFGGAARHGAALLETPLVLDDAEDLDLGHISTDTRGDLGCGRPGRLCASFPARKRRTVRDSISRWP